MTRVLEFLLGVDRISLESGQRIEFRFLSAWPAWAALLVLIVLFAYIWRIYRRESPGTPPLARGFLMFLRCLLVVLALCMLFEPALVLVRDEVIPSAVAILADRSASMSVGDGDKSDEAKVVEDVLRRGAVTPADAERPTRFEVTRAALGLDGGKALKDIASEQRIYLYTFDESPKLLWRIDNAEAVDMALADLAKVVADGTRSAQVHSMEMVLEQLAGQTLTGVILLTDGRSTASRSSDTLRQMAAARDIPFFVFGVGNTEAPKDAEIRSVTAKRWAFISEQPVVRVTLANHGYAGRQAQLELTVKDHPDLNVSQDVTLAESDVAQPVDLRLKPETPGTYEVSVRLRPLEGEFDEDNNVNLPLDIVVLERKPKVLLVEDLPRWEYQYLKNALYRDTTVQISVLLHSADLLFAPEGDLPIKVFPQTKEELFEYDVIIIGDVDRRLLSQKEIDLIDEFVRVKGGGLVLIAGRRLSNPNSYVGTALETLLPVYISDEQLAGNISRPWQPVMTIEGSVSPILKFEDDAQENSKAWESLSPFFWYYQARAAKPGAHVLLTQPDDDNPHSPDGKFPIMVLQRVDAGKVFFSATDETWRWRKYTGRRYFNSFWLQLVRHMALPQQEVTLETGRLRYALSDEVTLTLRAADPESIPETLEEVQAKVHWTSEDGSKTRTDEVTLQRTKAASKLAVFEKKFTPEAIGEYTVSAEMPTKRGAASAEADFVVAPSREEFQKPARDVALISEVARFTKESQALALADMASMAGRIVNRSRTVRNDLTDEIWDSPLALMLFVLVIGTEWILRKKYRML